MQERQETILTEVLDSIIKRTLNAEAQSWLFEKAALICKENNAAQLNMSFAAVPRKTGKQLIEVTELEKQQLRTVHPEYEVNDWTIDRACRVWLLLQLDASKKENYFSKITSLFKAAEMNELVALYSALPYFKHPEEWQKQCADGIRSNIGNVLEAIMYNNPYPYKYFSDGAWNQLVMKAFFTDKNVKRIIGLDERANKELASILIDYANERWAAHRPVHPQLWRLVTKFINADNFSNIEKAFNSKDALEKKAVALAAFFSDYAPAQDLLLSDQELRSAIAENKLNWNSL